MHRKQTATCHIDLSEDSFIEAEEQANKFESRLKNSTFSLSQLNEHSRSILNCLQERFKVKDLRKYQRWNEDVPQWIYFIPIKGKTDGAQKKKHKTLIYLTQTQQSETYADNYCKTLAQGWVLTGKLYRSNCDRITSSGLVTLYWRITNLLLVHGDKRSKNFAYFLYSKRTFSLSVAVKMRQNALRYK